MRLLLHPLIAFLGLFLGCASERIPLRPKGPDHAPLLVVFMSERPPSPAYAADLYRADLRTDDPPSLVPDVNTTNLEGPAALSGNGRTLAFFTNRLLLGSQALIMLYDLQAHAFYPKLPKVNTLGFPQNPSLSGDGRFLAVQYQLTGAFDLFVAMQDVAADTLLPLPTLNDPDATNFDPSLNGDASLIAFASNRITTQGAFDIYLYSVKGDSLIPLPGLNSSAQDLGASISADGRYIAFQSGRLGGVGLIDVYVYDRATASLLPLPGANTTLSEVQPAISPDGRYLAYTTEFTGGRDLRLYDITARRLLQVERLNADLFYDYNPVLASLPYVAVSDRIR